MGAVGVMVIDRRSRNAREMNVCAAGHLNRRSVWHPHVRRIRPVYVLDFLRHGLLPNYVAGVCDAVVGDATGWRKIARKGTSLGAALLPV